tara:strand:+ start:647 stop:5758 length:5112 start_codon:yes stop_codon:yes gene_type:complete
MGDATKLKMKCTFGAATPKYSTLGSIRATSSTDSLVFQWDHASETLRVKTKGGTTSAETITLDCSDLTTDGTDKYVVELLGYGGIDAVKDVHIEHIIANVTVYTDLLSATEIGNLHENRSPINSSLKHHFKLSEGGKVAPDSKTNSPHALFSDPAAVEVVDGKYLFNGRSSALRVQLTAEMENFFIKAGNNNPKVGFGGFIRFVALQDPSVGEQILVDAGDWFQLKITTAGTITYTSKSNRDMSNASLPWTKTTTTAQQSGGAITVGTEYEVYFGVQPGTLTPSSSALCRLRVDRVGVEQGTDVYSGFFSAIYLPPILDFSTAPKVYLGAEADESAKTNLGAAVVRFALYREWIYQDVRVNRDSIIYLEGDEFKDKTTQNVGVIPLIHSSTSSTPTYTVGPLVDGAHVSVAGGHVLGEAGVIGLTRGVQRLSHQVKSDADTLRVGDKLLIASNKVGHIVSESAQTVRPFGVPKPARNVSTRASAPGSLSGAASYGYRYVTADGTYGPMERTDPAAITSGQSGKFIVGANSGADSEFLDTAGQTSVTTTESMGAHTATTNPFTAGDDLCIEVAARLDEFDAGSTEETIWDRGLKGKDVGGVTPPTNKGYRTDESGSILSLDSDFTLQASFKFSATRRSPRNSAIGVFAVGKGTGVSHNVQANPGNLVAFITTGSDSTIYKASPSYLYYTHNGYGTTGTGSGATEGKGRLVIGIARANYNYEYTNRWFGGSNNNLSQVYGSPGYVAPHANYRTITFTDDAGTWIDGNDYTLIVKRTGLAIEVTVHDATRGIWSVLTPRSMNSIASIQNEMASGVFAPSVPGYDGTSFFENWTAPNASTRVSMLHSGFAGAPVPFMKDDGQMHPGFEWHATGGASPVARTCFDMVDSWSSQADNVWYQLLPSMVGLPMDETTGHPFHFRAWSVSIANSLLENYAHHRNAARPGHALQTGIEMDSAMMFEDLDDELVMWSDGYDPGILWRPLDMSSNAQSSYIDKPVMTFTQTTGYSDTMQQPVFVLGPSSADSLLSPLCLYFSSKGDGSLILQLYSATTGIQQYRLAHTLQGGGTDPLFNKSFYDFNDVVNEFDQWNVFSIGVKIGSGGDLIVSGLAINGNIIFDSPISRDVVPVASYNSSDWITLGGHTGSSPSNNRTTCYIGEFRMWEPDQGPSKFFTGSPGAAYWAVNDRLDSSQAANTHLYYTFKDSDLTSTELANKGNLAAGSSLTFDAGVVLYDERLASGDAVAFPLPPRDDIVAIELFRTQTVYIDDPTIETVVQDALDAARYAPLYFNQRLLSGTKSVSDTTPDIALGFSAPYTSYSNPEDIKQFFTWQGQVGVLGERNRIYYTEPGPFGWETFPATLMYEARISGGGAGELLGCRSTGDTLYLFGSNWTTALIGSPGNETEFAFGGGVGAYSPRATLDIAGIVYAFNGRLWTIDRVGQVDFKIQDVGHAFQDILPKHTRVRLSCISSLQSLFILDEDTGDTIRVFLPTGEASIEKRDAIAVTDNSNNENVWISPGGSYSIGSDTVYGDDVDSSTTSHSAGTLSTSNTRFDCSTTVTGINIGMRVGVVDVDGKTLDTRVSSVAGNNITLLSVAGLGTDKAGTIYFGASSEGMIIDTGYLDTGNQNSMLDSARVSLTVGTGVEVGLSASPVVGGRGSIADVEFASVSPNQETVGGHMRGRFVRGILRNRVPESTELSYIDIEIQKPYEK